VARFFTRIMAPTSPSSARVRVVRRSTAALTVADRDRIEAFINRYALFDRSTLDNALRSATYIWLCLDPQDRIVGTTSVRRLHLERGVGGHLRAPTVVYTSVVAVNPDFRRGGLPARMGLKTYLYERFRSPLAPLYWLAEAISPAGYLQMARNFDVYWPRPREPVPAQAQDVMDATLAAAGVTRVERVGSARLVREDYPVIEREQAPDRWDRKDHAVDYFLRTNPDYWTGAALVMLAPLNAYAVAADVTRNFRKVLARRRARALPEGSRGPIPQ
jgi:hypothetical protein